MYLDFVQETSSMEVRLLNSEFHLKWLAKSGFGAFFWVYFFFFLIYSGPCEAPMFASYPLY